VERSQICAAKDEKILDDLLILSCDEDHAICRPFLERGIHLPSNLLFYETNTQEQLLKKICGTTYTCRSSSLQFRDSTERDSYPETGIQKVSIGMTTTLQYLHMQAGLSLDPAFNRL
jgi:hypothetical protein